jgi:hypothetical protein
VSRGLAQSSALASGRVDALEKAEGKFLTIVIVIAVIRLPPCKKPRHDPGRTGQISWRTFMRSWLVWGFALLIGIVVAIAMRGMVDTLADQWTFPHVGRLVGVLCGAAVVGILHTIALRFGWIAESD